MREARTSGREARRAPRGIRKSSTPLFSQLLTAAVDTAGDAVAVSYSPVDGERRELTYTQLDEYSSRLARDLLERGIGPGDVVALGFTRSIESVAAVWAVAKTGAAYVPVDPALPADRIAYLLEDSGTILGLTCTAHRDKLGDCVDWLDIDAPAHHDRITAHPAHPISYLDRVRPLTDQHPAYVIYTSGSTGRPKGVVVTHAGLADLVAAASASAIASPRRLASLHVRSPNFDVSVLELLLAFGAGATLVIAPPHGASAAPSSPICCAANRSPTCSSPRRRWHRSTRTDLDDLRVVVVAGEACRPGPGRPLGRRRRAFFNGYGPTEATIHAPRQRPRCGPGRRRSPIGAPIAASVRSCWTRGCARCPSGVAGELYLAGAGAGPRLSRPARR